VIDGATDRALTTLDLADAYPSALCCVATAGKAYCGTDCGLVVIDSRTDSIRNWVAAGTYDEALGVVWSPTQDRVYYATWDSMWAVDVATDSVHAGIGPPCEDGYFAGGLVYGAALDQVYTVDDDYGSLVVIDCARNALVDVIPFLNELPEEPGGLCADPFAGKVYCVDFSDDGEDGAITSCDVAERVVNHITAGAWPAALAASTRDRLLIGADADGSAALVIDTGHDSLVATVAFDDWPRVVLPGRDGSRLYLGCDNGALLALDAETGSLRSRLDFSGSLRALRLNPSGQLLFCADYYADSVRVVDTDADSLVAQFAVGHRPNAFYCDSLRDRIYCVSRSETYVAVIDATSGSLLDSISLVADPRLSCHDPVAGRLYAYSYSSHTYRVSVVDCGRDSVVAEVVLPHKLSALCSNPTRNEVYAAHPNDDDVAVIDGASNSIVADIAMDGRPSALCYSPVGRKMYCIQYDLGQVAAIDCSTRTVVARIPVGPSPESLWYNPASNHVFCGIKGSDAVAVIDAATDSVVATIPVRGNPFGFAGSRAGDRVYVNCNGVPFVHVIGDRLPPSPVTGSGGSTFFRGRAFLLGSDPARLVNAAGRVVATLQPGDNNVSHLAPGVYFAIPARTGRKASKLVVLR